VNIPLRALTEAESRPFLSIDFCWRYTGVEMGLRIVCGLVLSTARASRIRAGVLGLCILMSQNALAFHYPLQPEEVREAYSLGQTTNHNDLADFYKQYLHTFRYPSDQPLVNVQSIEFRTPYEQIVLRSHRAGGLYDAFQADEDYRKNAGLVLVRIVITFKIAYVGPLPSIDAFQFLVSQASPITPHEITHSIICNPLFDGSGCLAPVEEVLLSFDSKQFEPGKATVKVLTPDGQTLQAKFNLDHLK
jgi:hypothetical protein